MQTEDFFKECAHMRGDTTTKVAASGQLEDGRDYQLQMVMTTNKARFINSQEDALVRQPGGLDLVEEYAFEE